VGCIILFYAIDLYPHQIKFRCLSYWHKFVMLGNDNDQQSLFSAKKIKFPYLACYRWSVPCGRWYCYVKKKTRCELNAVAVMLRWFSSGLLILALWKWEAQTLLLVSRYAAYYNPRPASDAHCGFAVKGDGIFIHKGEHLDGSHSLSYYIIAGVPCNMVYAVQYCAKQPEEAASARAITPLSLFLFPVC